MVGASHSITPRLARRARTDPAESLRASLKIALIGVALIISAIAVAAAVWSFTFGPYRRVEIPDALAGAAPAVLGPFAGEPAIADRSAWSSRRELLLQSLAEHVYGPPPPNHLARVVRRSAIPSDQAGGVAGVEQWEVLIEDVGRLNLIVVLPPARDDPAPAIVMQNFCGNRAAFPGRPAAIAAPLRYYPGPCRSGVFDPLHRAAFGRWMLGPPYQRISERGYALAMFYGGDIIPDHAPDARPALDSLGGPDMGALSAWAWVHARVVDVLRTDPRLDPDRIVAWGQSRYGKIALLAAARDERIAAVVALQSGRGGDALTSHRVGEGVASITGVYPHWFSPRFRGYAERDPPVDQHQLLALLAPRPVLLGWARRDEWSDPIGALMAAQSAAPAFALLGSPGPATFFRDGGHGITDADWQASLDFLDALVAH